MDNLLSNPSTLIDATNSINGQGGKTFSELISSNPLFTGGAGLVGVGIILSYFRRLSLIGKELLKRKFISRLELDNTDIAFQWVLDYINKNSKRRTSILTVNTSQLSDDSGRLKTSFMFTPGRGTHYLFFKNRWVQVNRERQNQTIKKDGMTRTALEVVSLTTFGGNPTFWKSFLENAAKDALSQLETGLCVYIPHGNSWQRLGAPRNKRPIDSVILDIGVKERLLDDISNFFTSQQWYIDRGIPYRRGYLLHGPPGTGKSSFISALAALYGHNIFIEDVDSAFGGRHDGVIQHNPVYDGLSRVTMSGLLNAVDGVASAEGGRVLFMTTNHVERLDAALIRPGRVDVSQHFGNCTPIMFEQMFKRFFENVPDTLCSKFRDKMLSIGIECSPATIQGHLLNFKNQPGLAIENIENFKSKMTSIVQSAQPLSEVKKLKTFDLATNLETSIVGSQNTKSDDEVYDTSYLTENDGLIAVGSNTENLLILNVKNGKRNYAKGSKDNSIILWNIQKNEKEDLMEVDDEENEVEDEEKSTNNILVKQMAIASGHTHSVSSISFSHLNKPPFLVSVSHDTTLKLWPLVDLMVKQEKLEEIEENKLLKLSASTTIVAHTKDINSVDVSQNDKLCVTASMDKTAKLWHINLKTMELANAGILSGHKRGVWCARFSKNLQLVATCSGDCTIKIFSLLDKSCIKTLEGHQFAVLSILFIENSSKLISVDGGGILRLWNVKKGICECVEEGHNEKIWSLRELPNDINLQQKSEDIEEETDDFNKLSDSYWITGAANGLLTIWRDNTKIMKALTQKEATKKITDQQTLSNLLQQNHLFEALLYTLDLDLPFQCLKILQRLSSDIVATSENDQLQKLINIFKKLSKIQLSALLGYSTQWNTNSRTYSVAQLVLNCVLRAIPPEELIELPNIENIVQRFLPYSLRHQERIKNFRKSAAHIDYMFSSMRLNEI
uniref:BCS1 N-terminal domain-containing protein n=1 Tax=Meloidogyne javanica TaxID=6303 RepID=A0A915MUH1_MELJA